MRRNQLLKMVLPLGIFLVMASAVYAFQLPSILTDAFEWVFGTLPNLPPQYRFVYLKVFIWIPIYALFYYLIKKQLIKDHPKTANIIAFSLSILSVAFIPDGVVEAIVMTYALVLGFVIPAALIIGVVSLARTTENPFVKGAVYFLTFFVLLWIDAAMATSAPPFGPTYVQNIQGWIQLVALIAFIMFFIELLKLFGHIFHVGEKEVVTPLAKGLAESEDYQKLKEKITGEEKRAEREEKFMRYLSWLTGTQIQKEEDLLKYLERVKAAIGTLTTGTFGRATPEQIEANLQKLATNLEAVLAANRELAKKEEEIKRIEKRIVAWQSRTTANMERYKKQLTDPEVRELIQQIETDSLELYKDERNVRDTIKEILALEDDFVKDIQGAIDTIKSPEGEPHARAARIVKFVDNAIENKRRSIELLGYVKTMADKFQEVETKVRSLEKRAKQGK